MVPHSIHRVVWYANQQLRRSPRTHSTLTCSLHVRVKMTSSPLRLRSPACAPRRHQSEPDSPTDQIKFWNISKTPNDTTTMAVPTTAFNTPPTATNEDNVCIFFHHSDNHTSSNYHQTITWQSQSLTTYRLRVVLTKSPGPDYTMEWELFDAAAILVRHKASITLAQIATPPLSVYSAISASHPTLIIT
ncbi:hypothetical protein [Sclerotinia sclerotiorum alphaflexivirus 1]|nr:hypothetical protein [Sclerotinia sclerotiorum alphaflexivirus 1]